MIGQPKPFASLSSTLLARKGTARPAMRPQGFGGFGALQTQDDLGWNDMGDPHDGHGHHDVPPAVPPVLMQREALQREMIGDEFDAPPVAAAPFFDSFENEFEEPEQDYVPAIESVLAVKPVRTVEASAEAAPLAIQPPVAVTPLVAAVPAPVAAATDIAEAVPVAATLPPARAAQIVRETSAKKGKAAFTLRLDHDRHLQLRLASALRNRSAQQLVTEALDAFFETLPEVTELANQLSPPAAR
ncbi:hypothetical protein [Sphingomonas sp.]|uniref:hypothetical protein n=1 Tax=Sphingomonas sp. TaxID=28214 RepID=UPI003D6D9A4B